MDGAGRLCVAGLDLAALARAYGTPLYVFDEATIRTRCRAFRQAFAERWPQSAMAYAGKAYLSPALCRLLLEEGVELDAVSLGEVGVARASGYPAAQIHLHGNFKPDHELAAALEAGVGRVVVDSLDEQARLEKLARTRGHPATIWLRLRPAVAVETHASIQTGHATSKFGLDLASGEALVAAERAIASPWLDLCGLHAHVGSQLFDVAPLARVVTLLGEFAALLRERFGAAAAAAVRELSPGGGLGVAYTPDQRAPALSAYAETVTRALAAVVERHRLPPPRLVIEPGRALIAQAGVALYTIGPRKTVARDGVGPSLSLLAVDGGMGDNPRPALYGARYFAALPARMTEPATDVVRVVGRYCESGDVLVEEVALPPPRHTGRQIQENDEQADEEKAEGEQEEEVLAIPVSGAYHLPLASTYNLVPRPAVLFLHEGHARVVRRRETLEDMLRLEQG